jgi:Mg/Co/Ni transporter MgtE
VHAVKLNVEDKAFDKVLYLLKSLPEGDVEIILDNSVESEDKIVTKSIDFSKYSIESLTKIEDPVEWQRSIRDEWER